MKSFLYKRQMTVTSNDSTANEIFNLKEYLLAPRERSLPGYTDPRAEGKKTKTLISCNCLINRIKKQPIMR